MTDSSEREEEEEKKILYQKEISPSLVVVPRQV